MNEQTNSATVNASAPTRGARKKLPLWDKGPFALLTGAWGRMRAAGNRLVALILATQILQVVIVFPLLAWLFSEVFRVSGIQAIDIQNLPFTGNLVLSVTLLLVFVIAALWFISLQFTALLTLLASPHVSLRGFAAEFGRVTRKLLRPSSIPLLLYVFLVVPLAGFGFVSSMTRFIAIPNFITGELAKMPIINVFLVAFFVFIVFLNIRWALTLPVFVYTNATGWKSLVISWKLTSSWRTLYLMLAVFITTTVVGLIVALTLFVLWLPTVFADDLAPAAAPVIAAFSLGLGQAIGLILGGLTVALISGLLIAFARQQALAKPHVFIDRNVSLYRADIIGAQFDSAEDAAARFAGGPTRIPVLDQIDIDEDDTESDSAKNGVGAAASDVATKKSDRRLGVLVGAGFVGTALVFGVFAIPVMNQMAQAPETVVIGHRGAAGAPENTISSLELAAEQGAEIVEMDVMQTKDHQYVVMHDHNLKRLTGQDLAVKDLTLDEITKMKVLDQNGSEDFIPSLVDYAQRAKELGMPLLIEIKFSGAEGPDHVSELLALLDDNDLYEGNIFHSLSPEAVDQLKTQRPEAAVGYLMPLAGLNVPDTKADFLGVEEWTATRNFMGMVHDKGLGFIVWTVNDPENMQDRLRSGVDAIVTDYPDQVVAAREEIQGETGISMALLDAMRQFIKVT